MEKQKVFIQCSKDEMFDGVILHKKELMQIPVKEVEGYFFTPDELEKFSRKVLQGGINIGLCGYPSHTRVMASSKDNYIQSLNIN